jgi:glycosyltransferase involved in cell wall biosynthesis
MGRREGIDVIMPCFNAERYVGRAVRSALAAEEDVENFVAIDDASTDHSVEILEGFGNRVTIIRNTESRQWGPAKARNIGLMNSYSGFVAFIDADDIWYGDKLRGQAEVLRGNPSVGLVYTYCLGVDECDRTLFEFPTRGAYGSGPHGMLMDCFIPTPSCVMVRRSILELVGGFNEDLRGPEDHDLWIRLREVTKLDCVEKYLVGYRQHSQGLSKAGRRGMWSAGFKVLENACRRYPYGLRTKRRRIAVLNYRLGQCNMADGRYVRALVRFSRAAVNDLARAVRLALSGIRWKSEP